MSVFCGAFARKKWRASLYWVVALAMMGLGRLSFGEAEQKLTEEGSGKQIVVSYAFPPPTVELANERARVSMPGLSLLVQEGKPVVPFKTARLLLPPSGTIAAIDVTGAGRKDIPGEFELEIGQAPRPTRSNDSTLSKGSPTFAEGEPFPGRLYDLASVQKLRGYRMAILRLYPVQYTAATGQLTYYQTLTVALSLTPVSGEAAKAVRPALFRGYAPDEGRVRGAVDNPQTLKTYPRPEQQRWEKDLILNGKLEAGESQKLSSCEYLIITKASYVPKFEPLLEWKTQKGLTGKIATVEEIKETYEGDDLQEQIRNFIADCYQNLGTEYVLLGGDTEIIPHRGMYGEVGAYIDERIPADLYYGCLDGTWDYDGDGIYGESEDGEEGGEVDLVAEVYVGRAPVSNQPEAENFVRKTLRYEVERSPNLSRALWVGQQLDGKTWGGDYKEELVVLLPENIEVTRLYQKNGTFWKESVINALNDSPHIINHLGHGEKAEVLKLSRSDVDDLHNEFPFFFYTQACDVGAFDYDDAIAEHFVKREAGAFAVIANSRYGWYVEGTTLGTSQVFDEEFLKAVFGKGITNLGRALQESKEANIAEVLPIGAERWCYFQLTLFGDPETPLFTATSKGLVRFDHPRYSTRTPLEVSVADMDLNTNPLVTEVAEVALMSPGDMEPIFALETTSNSGVFAAEVPLSTSAPALDGVLQVRDGDKVTARYEDADDGSGVSQTVTATATIDDSPPTLSNVRVAEVRDTWAVIEWQSNETATARVDYGVSLPFTSSAYDGTMTRYHRVAVSGLEKETVYRFRVAAIDLVGNEGVDENNGNYYSFETKHRVFLFSDDVEEGSPSAAGEWSHHVVSGGVSDWEITTDDSRSPTSCWHTDDHPFPSANVLDTPVIDLQGMTTAQLSFWHRMLSETNWDGGFVQVQREGTDGWASLTQEQMMEGTPFVTLSIGNPSGDVPGWSGNIPWERVTFDLAEYAGDKITIRFRMESDDNTDAGEGDGWYIDDIAVTRAMGTVNLDKRFYRMGDVIVITVLDASANLDPETAEAVSVEVSSTREDIPEIVTLTETEPDSSTFVGEIVTAKTKMENDGMLGVSNDDAITVSYAQAEPATAIADLMAPAISNVESTQVDHSSAIIKWRTDEECRGAVTYGTNPLALDRIAPEATRGLLHELRLTDLQPRSRYYFKVDAVDRAGNSVVDDNDGKLHSFLTLGFSQGGLITEDTVWRYVEGHPYVISASVYVGNAKDDKPVTLTIEPGVVVQFKADDRDLYIRGGLVARGVTFEFDLPSGKWAHIIFEEGASGVIDNSVISASGSPDQLSGGIECYSSNIQFTDNIVRNTYYGFHCMSCSPRISGNTFIVCKYGVFLHAAAGRYSSPEISGNTFFGCERPIVCEDRTYPVISGNVFEGNNYDGLIRSFVTEDAIWPGYDCPQYLTGDLAVPADRTLFIAPGATIRFAESGGDLFVSGNLHAEGATIEFTVPPEPRTFLTLASTSSGSIRNCRIVGKSPDGARTGGIKCQSSDVSLSGNVISNTYYGVFCAPSKSPLIANNTIVGCEFGIYAPDATPKVTNCILWNNGDDLMGCGGTFLDVRDGDPGEGNISLDPLFRDAAAGDFSLQAGSPCIDSGTSEMAPPLDANGYVRWDDPDVPNTGGGSSPYFDIGAYESVVDADGDFVCDKWEIENGLNPADAGDARADTDGDGKSNREEYVSGTDPADPSSCLRVISLHSVEDETEGIAVGWPTVPGKRYRVFYTERLSPSCGRKVPSGGRVEGFPDLTVWKACSDVMEGTGDFFSILDAGDSKRKAPSDSLVPRRFYRVEVR